MKLRELIEEGLIRRIFTRHKKKKDSKGTIKYYNKAGKLDNPDKDTPAVEYKNGDQERWTNGKLTDTWEPGEGIKTHYKNGKMFSRSSPGGGASYSRYDEKGKRIRKHSIGGGGGRSSGGYSGSRSRGSSGGSYGGGASSVNISGVMYD